MGILADTISQQELVHVTENPKVMIGDPNHQAVRLTTEVNISATLANLPSEQEALPPLMTQLCCG